MSVVLWRCPSCGEVWRGVYGQPGSFLPAGAPRHPAPEEFVMEGTANSEQRLFGVVGAELLYRSVAQLYEHAIENWYDPGVEVEVEEWTVADNRQFMPTADHLIDFVVDYLADEAVVEGWYENAENHAGDAEVEDAFTQALNFVRWSAHLLDGRQARRISSGRDW